MSDIRIVVIGGGIAGVSAAWALLDGPDPPEVVLVEAESQLAHHTTGRSAAQLIENYGAAPVRPLTTASLDFFRAPPDELVEAPLLRSRPLLMVAGPDQGAAVDSTLADARSGCGDGDPTMIEITAEEAVGYFPPLRPQRVHRAVLEPDSADIDVAGLHQAFVRGLRRRGGQIRTSTRVDSAEPDGAGWRVHTTQGLLGADLIVNAAGAWGDVVARTAGVAEVGLRPLRRTAFMVRAPSNDAAGWPLTGDIEHSWYLKPDGPQLLCSPGDETPSEPCDARPEEVDIAVAIERINEATTLDIRSIVSSWAGLRTFSPDGSMVIGPEPSRPEFMWCVGQGGTGIQTSPGAGRLVADLIEHGAPGTAFDGLPMDLAGLLPDRFR
jgi:D-arginine dehydrogenase